MKISLVIVVLALALVPACDTHKAVKSGAHTMEDVLIKKGFMDNNTYRIVCRGYPQEGLTGIQKVESAKRAALLNAYYFVKNTFDESVAPDTDGRAEKFDVSSDHAVVYYVIRKIGLKRLAIGK